MSERYRLNLFPLKDKIALGDTDQINAEPIIKADRITGTKRFDNSYCTWRSYNKRELPLWKLGYIPQTEKDYNTELKAGILKLGIQDQVKPEDYVNTGAFDIENLKKKPADGSVQATWLGHASVLIQFSNGVNCLVDPMFSKRSSPVQFIGPKRNIKAPLTVKYLKDKGIQIHVVLISHNHHDHLDKGSIAQLKKHFPDVQFIVPLKTSHSICTKNETKIQELNWWQDITLTIENMPVTITAVPAQHWTQRNAIDERKSLWAGYVIKSADAKCYFAGDSGYCRAFKDIGKKFPEITLALIPIGAYLPRWFMNPQHISPEEAVQVFNDLGCKNALGIHWGTFDLADDRNVEPVQELEYFKKTTDSADGFIVTPIGETREYR